MTSGRHGESLDYDAPIQRVAPRLPRCNPWEGLISRDAAVLVSPMNRYLLIVALTATLVACPESCDGPTSPGDGGQTTTSIPSELSPIPRVDSPFSIDAYRGAIAFGLGHPMQSEEDVLSFVNAFMIMGWNTFEVCSETEFWDGTFQYPRKPRDLERLRWLLDIFARIPGAQVALIGNCTLKRQVPLDEQANWALAVAGTVAGKNCYPSGTCDLPAIQERYKNVAIFTHNEFDNCRGRFDWGGNGDWCAGKQDVRKHIDIYRHEGIEIVTADDSYHPPDPNDLDKSYSFRLANIGAAPASFHPDRTKDGRPWDPSLHQLRQLGRYNGTFLLSETVAWADFSGNCQGLRTCDEQRIIDYIGRCAQVPECRFTFHCEHCLNGEIPTFIPAAR